MSTGTLVALTMCWNIPQNPLERRDQVPILRISTADGPAEEETTAGDEPKDFHAKGHVSEQ